MKAADENLCEGITLCDPPQNLLKEFFWCINSPQASRYFNFDGWVVCPEGSVGCGDPIHEWVEIIPEVGGDAASSVSAHFSQVSQRVSMMVPTPL